ncbi:MAG: hypothetical protein E6G76_08575 [Alphaproteobacteria bacterium]|nr:MAG: hypothetical protein E6G76_08575 [Alphaproteobacteria bacterium]
MPSLTADEAGQLKMMQIVLVGLGAGAAAALLLASVVSGSIAAIFLFYLAPLPILIAALGWNHIAGLIAAAVATAAITVLSGTLLIAVPVIAFGSWWLGYCALLARPASNGGAGALEWYPPGRLVLWAAVIGTLIVAAAVPNFGTDQQSVQAALRKAYEGILRDQSLIDMLVVAVPPGAAVFSTVTNMFNLWLAARIVKISGRLRRPWPDLANLTLPAASSGLLAAAIAGSLAGPLRHTLRRVCGKSAHGLRNARPCSPACDHARIEQSRRRAGGRLCRHHRARLAALGAVASGPCRSRLQHSQSCCT